MSPSSASQLVALVSFLDFRLIHAHVQTFPNVYYVDMWILHTYRMYIFTQEMTFTDVKRSDRRKTFALVFFLTHSSLQLCFSLTEVPFFFSTLFPVCSTLVSTDTFLCMTQVKHGMSKNVQDKGLEKRERKRKEQKGSKLFLLSRFRRIPSHFVYPSQTSFLAVQQWLVIRKLQRGNIRRLLVLIFGDMLQG